MEALKRFLIWSRLQDAHDGTMSLTSLSQMVILGCVVWVVGHSGSVSVTELGALIVTVTAATAKKVLHQRTLSAQQQSQDQLKALSQSIAAQGQELNQRLVRLENRFGLGK